MLASCSMADISKVIFTKSCWTSKVPAVSAKALAHRTGHSGSSMGSSSHTWLVRCSDLRQGPAASGAARNCESATKHQVWLRFLGLHLSKRSLPRGSRELATVVGLESKPWSRSTKALQGCIARWISHSCETRGWPYQRRKDGRWPVPQRHFRSCQVSWLSGKSSLT